MKLTNIRPPTPPDGGWGWVIVAAVFSLHFLLSGDAAAFPVLLPDLATSFGVSKSLVSWAGSIRFGGCYASGPLVGLLVNRYGCRRVTLLGTAIVFLAGSLSAFAPNVTTFILTFGVLQGIGHGLTFIPSIIVVGTYFEKRRAVAIGIACSGGGVGGVFIPPILKFLMEEFSWRGAILLTSVSMLNIIACALLFRDLADVKGREETPPVAIKLDGEDPLDVSQLLTEDGSIMLVTPTSSRNSFMDPDCNGIVSPRKESIVSIKLAPSFIGIESSSRRNSSLTSEAILPDLNMIRSGSQLPAIVEDAPSDEEIKKSTESIFKKKTKVGGFPPTDLRVFTLRRESRLSKASTNSGRTGASGGKHSQRGSIETQNQFFIGGSGGKHSQRGSIEMQNEFFTGASRGKHSQQRGSIETQNQFFKGLDPRPQITPTGWDWPTTNLPYDPQTLALRRQTATGGNCAFYLIENKNGRRKPWSRNLVGGDEEEEMRRFSLHSVPTRISLAWMEKTGREPDPDILLKFKPPSSTTSSASSTRKMFRPLDRKDVLYGSSIFDLDHFESKRSGLALPRENLLRQADETLINVEDSVDVSVDASADASVDEREPAKRSLLQSPSFWIHCFNNALFTFAFCIPSTFLISFAQSLDITVAKAKYLLSIIGVVNCIGRFGIGFVSDLMHIRGIHLAAFGMIVSGISTATVILLPSDFSSLATYAALFAVGSAIYATLESIVVVELFGLERLTECFGYLQFFRGVGAILGPPFGGYIAEENGNYQWQWILLAAGILMVMSGVFQGLLYVIASREGEILSRQSWENRKKSSSIMRELNNILAQPREQLI